MYSFFLMSRLACMSVFPHVGQERARAIFLTCGGGVGLHLRYKRASWAPQGVEVQFLVFQVFFYLSNWRCHNGIYGLSSPCNIGTLFARYARLMNPNPASSQPANFVTTPPRAAHTQQNMNATSMSPL